VNVLTASGAKIRRTSGGRSLTDDLVEKLAERAEAGYDVEETLHRRCPKIKAAIKANRETLRRLAK
jgi:hypothetical protein